MQLMAQHAMFPLQRHVDCMTIMLTLASSYHAAHDVIPHWLHHADVYTAAVYLR